MNKTYALVNVVKEKTGVTSDYGIAEMLNIPRQMVSSWKANKSEANAINTLKLMKAAGLSIDDALNIMTKESQNDRPASNQNADSLYIM